MDYSKQEIKMMKKMAENLEEYLYIVENYIIIDGITKEEYDDAVSTVKKLIKKLKNGKGDDVFDRKRYIELRENGELDDM